MCFGGGGGGNSTAYTSTVSQADLDRQRAKQTEDERAARLAGLGDQGRLTRIGESADDRLGSTNVGVVDPQNTPGSYGAISRYGEYPSGGRKI